MDAFLTILRIVGSLCLFIYGMKVMSEGIQRAAGTSLRGILRSMTSNRYLGVISGFSLTTLVQSSSATTVMTVSFVNAGLLTLVEAAGVMMGANIGTTITGWLVAIGTGKFELAEYVLPILGIGLPLIFINNARTRFWGEFIIGFSLLFLGLNFLQQSVPDLQSNPGYLEFLKTYSNNGYASLISFVFIGALLTIVIQSSSAAMALTLVMVSKGWIPIETAGAMILGENIGTTLTAEIASLVGNVHAKRSARIHSLFNIIGVGWVILLVPIVIPALYNFVDTQLVGRFATANSNTITIALFHSLFNLTNVLLLIGFTPWLIALAKRTVRSKGEEDEVFRLEYLNTMVKTPELSILEVQKEVSRFGELTSRMSQFTKDLFLTTNPSERKSLYKRVKKYEVITNRIESELSDYLTKISGDRLSPKVSQQVRSLLSVCGDMERIGDIFLQISKNIKRKGEQKIWFNQAQRNQVLNMFSLIDDAFNIMLKNLDQNRFDNISLTAADAIEKQINKFRKSMRNEIFDDKDEAAIVHSDSQIVFTLLINQLEKIGNCIYNISDILAVSE